MIFDVRSTYDVMAINALTKDAIPRKVGITSGCFDLFHFYHLVYLERCKRFCDYLIVGVDSDDFVKSIKGPNRPINHDFRRAQVLNALRCVDCVFIMNTANDLDLACANFTPDMMFKNDAFASMPKEQILGAKYCKEVMIISDLTRQDSTSEIIESIQRDNRKLSG